MASSSSSNSNDLLKFMNTATSNIQEALGRSTKSKKVNHRKYLEKRLHRGPRTVKKSKPTPVSISAICNRQPVAELIAVASNATTQQQYMQQNEYDQLYQLVTQPAAFPSTPTTFAAYSRPPSAHEADLCDPEIESLLSEFVDSPSQCSLYGDSSSAGGSSSRGSLVSGMCSSTSLSMENTLITPSDCYVLSPPSDFSDFDESNYSSPRNPSPISAYHPPPSVSPPVATTTGSMYYHRNLTATYDCIPTSSTSAVSHDRPNGLAVPYNPSISELLAELISTP